MSSVFRDCLELWRTMRLKTVVILCLLAGVFGAQANNTETVSVMVGDSVTLQTDIGEIKRKGDIAWKFGSDSPDTLIAEIIKWSYMFYIYVSQQVPFRDRLQADYQTGSLTIKKTTPEHSGVYKLTIVNGRKTSTRRFTVNVYAPLPVPVIYRASQNFTASKQSSGPACVLMCSVKNSTRATLSLYRGNDLVSSVSGSGLNNTLSIPLEIEDLDKNTYSCVVNNPFSNQTALLNASDLCQPTSEERKYRTSTEQHEDSNSLLYCLLLLLLIPAMTVVIVCAYRKRRKAEQETDETC